MRRAQRVIIGAAIAASLWMPSTAAGRSSASQGYEPPGGRVQQQVSEKSTPRLPFTGLDLSLTGAGGVMLVAIGLGIRRLARPEAR